MRFPRALRRSSRRRWKRRTSRSWLPAAVPRWRGRKKPNGVRQERRVVFRQTQKCECPTGVAFSSPCGPAPLVDHGTTVPGRWRSPGRLFHASVAANFCLAKNTRRSNGAFSGGARGGTPRPSRGARGGTPRMKTARGQKVRLRPWPGPARRPCNKRPRSLALPGHVCSMVVPQIPVDLGLTGH